MEIMIKATDKLTSIDGVRVRLWEGTTASGIPCKVFVHMIAVAVEEDSSQFDAELQQQMPPGRMEPLSMIL